MCGAGSSGVFAIVGGQAFPPFRAATVMERSSNRLQKYPTIPDSRCLSPSRPSANSSDRERRRGLFSDLQPRLLVMFVGRTVSTEHKELDPSACRLQVPRESFHRDPERECGGFFVTCRRLHFMLFSKVRLESCEFRISFSYLPPPARSRKTLIWLR